jgi:peroxiredoxin
MPTPWVLTGALLASVLQPLVVAAQTPLARPADALVSGHSNPALAFPTLTAQTTAGKGVSLQALRGQVVLVMVWSTDCPVCLSKMPELRANLTGWQTQRFSIITINTDARPESLQSWEAARAATVPLAQQWPSLWMGSPGFVTSLPVDAPKASSGAHLPTIFILDRKGQLRLHTTGRVPAAVWDTIAELL